MIPAMLLMFGLGLEARAADGPVGTWYLNANNARLTLTLTEGAEPGTFSGTIAPEGGVASPIDGMAWEPDSRVLTFRRDGDGSWQWYRASLADGVLIGRFSQSKDSADAPKAPEAFASHVTGWNGDVADRDLAPRVYELLINTRYRARLRIDRAESGDVPFAGRLKVYSTVDGGARGEEAEHDIQITHWDGKDLRFIRRGTGWTQEYAGAVKGRQVEGTFRRVGSPEEIVWKGHRAEILGYGFSPKSPRDRETWQERTRRSLFRLMMADNPEPLSRVVTTIRPIGATTDDMPPMASTKLPPHRDDDPAAWPQAYRLRELRFDYTLPNARGGPPIERTSHGYLAVPTTPPPASGKYPAVLAVNGHGGGAWQMMNPDSQYFWYGDAFARRGYVVLAVDISHRAVEGRRGLYRGLDHGDDPEHGNPARPAIKAEGFDSDWEEDGERTWDSMRAADYLLSLPNVDPDRLLVTGISLGGEVTSFTGGLDTRFALSIPCGYSPDMGVMTYYDNHPCWRWVNADIREYIDISDTYALTAPRALIIQTGKVDGIFSALPSPFAADKQVARRARAAFGGQAHRMLHYLHYDQHHYHAGDRNPSRPTERGLRVPLVNEPTAPWASDWQSDGGTYLERATLFDFVDLYLGKK